jgi:phosphoribosylformimino-5-aminoimidazole carboxamide ribotide isomerase
MELWPAIDLRGGKCVRLQQGDYGRETVFGDDPAAMARHWVSLGAQRLHVVDLDGARDGRPANLAAVRSILAAASVPCQFGGGVRDEATIERLLDSGVERVVVGTRALREPEWFQGACRRFPGRLVLGIDARDGRVAAEGWLQTSEVAATDLARRYAGLPLAAVVYTDIARDGMLAGPNYAALREMAAVAPAPLVASGGISTLEDIRRLARLPVAGCIVGRALYEGRLPLPDALRAAAEAPSVAAPVAKTQGGLAEGPPLAAER